jgi:hypothetical protein
VSGPTREHGHWVYQPTSAEVDAKAREMYPSIDPPSAITRANARAALNRRRLRSRIDFPAAYRFVKASEVRHRGPAPPRRRGQRRGSLRFVKILPHNPPSVGEIVLVDGERCRVTSATIKWDGLHWDLLGLRVKDAADG